MKKRRGSGYTILEVMIFMAISASMFVLAITTISGRQQQVRFTQAVRDFDSKLQDILNDVSTGYFQTAGRINCDVPPGANTRPNIGYDNPTPPDAGTNSECVFIGKVIHFSPDNGTSENQSQFNIYDIVGRRFVSSDIRPVSLDEAKPVAVQIANINELQSGMKVTKIAREDDPSTIGAIGVFTGTNKNIQADYNSNNETINVANLPNTAFDQAPGEIYAITDLITDAVGPGNFVDMSSTSRIIICLSDTGNKRKASITFGGNEISTKLDFDTYNTEVCGL